MTRAIVLAMTLVLAGCGGGAPREARAPAARALPAATGPINTACMQSGREARSGRLCGCIQAAADEILTPAQQRSAIAFYADPHLAQELRQSDRDADRRLWGAYVAYGKRAEALCA